MSTTTGIHPHGVGHGLATTTRASFCVYNTPAEVRR